MHCMCSACKLWAANVLPPSNSAWSFLWCKLCVMSTIDASIHACVCVYMFLFTPGTQNNSVVKSCLFAFSFTHFFFYFCFTFHLYFYTCLSIHPSSCACLSLSLSLSPYLSPYVSLAHLSCLCHPAWFSCLSTSFALFPSSVPAYLYPCLPFLISLFPSEKCNLLTAQLSDE